MSQIKCKGTKPELILRKIVYSLKIRYRLHSNKLPGKPDLVITRQKKIIFVNGCFWHKHNCKYGRVRPRTNMKFWENKRNENRLRDRRNVAALRRLGWKVLIVWECQTRSSRLKWLNNRLETFLKIRRSENVIRLKQ